MYPFTINLSKKHALRDLERLKDPPTVNVIRQLANLTLGSVFNPNCFDSSSIVVVVYINNNLIYNTFIDLGETINVMTKDTMLRLNVKSLLRHTLTVLQLVDRSTVNPEGV